MGHPQSVYRCFAPNTPRLSKTVGASRGTEGVENPLEAVLEVLVVVVVVVVVVVIVVAVVVTVIVIGI